jgi:hypothetical protein
MGKNKYMNVPTGIVSASVVEEKDSEHPNAER